MNYNRVSYISLAIVTILALILGYTISELIYDSESVYKSVVKFVIVIFSITTFYSPLKYFMLKKLKIDIEEEAQKNEE